MKDLTKSTLSSNTPSNRSRGYSIGIHGRTGKGGCVLHLTESLFGCDTSLSDTKWPGGPWYLSDEMPGIHHEGNKEEQ